ncbi:prepilin-type N-terminal cleavage/methylation domain-containing protein [Thermus sp.]|uniref:prepilin-type N-terminal cleavage/methylation domain-containing protein n=1 Tax=Thermus sp. TaxID=275 RepID=UPI002635E092|nr:prepilin-type N-terminal cleavage/methylation domain-containing protein [Thermus sp.]MCX7848607.1 prepilin-type N-terminal cleavage/methylation domain-containing protein [Thermus sp.]
MRQGFALIELALVLLIVGVLVAVAVPRFVDLSVQAERAAAQKTLLALNSTVRILTVRLGRPPTLDEVWEALDSPYKKDVWEEPFLKRNPYGSYNYQIVLRYRPGREYCMDGYNPLGGLAEAGSPNEPRAQIVVFRPYTSGHGDYCQGEF